MIKNKEYDKIIYILEDYRNAYNVRHDKINNLYNEINVIKRLKI